jgi:hypothetical protein
VPSSSTSRSSTTASGATPHSGCAPRSNTRESTTTTTHSHSRIKQADSTKVGDHHSLYETRGGSCRQVVDAIRWNLGWRNPARHRFRPQAVAPSGCCASRHASAACGDGRALYGSGLDGGRPSDCDAGRLIESFHVGDGVGGHRLVERLSFMGAFSLGRPDCRDRGRRKCCRTPRITAEPPVHRIWHRDRRVHLAFTPGLARVLFRHKPWVASCHPKGKPYLATRRRSQPTTRPAVN